MKVIQRQGEDINIIFNISKTPRGKCILTKDKAAKESLMPEF